MVTIIVVLGLAIPVLLNMWAGVAWRSGRTEALAEATFYAQELMEEVKSKDFVDPQEPTNTNLGPNGGESSSNKDTFDDVDDFMGCTDSLVTTPATGYTRSVVVGYVTLSGNSWVSSGSPTPFKRIQVTVSRTDNLAKDVSLITVVAAY